MRRLPLALALLALVGVTTSSARAECEGNVSYCPFCYYEVCNPKTCICRCVFAVECMEAPPSIQTVSDDLAQLTAAIFSGEASQGMVCQ